METVSILNDFEGQNGKVNLTEMEFFPSYVIDYINFQDLHDFDIYMDVKNPLADLSKIDERDHLHTN